MSRVAIEGFLIDDENEEKFEQHGLSVRQVVEVLENTHLILRNRKRRRGIYLVIGTDNGGTCIAVPVERTQQPKLWRPITAWPCKPSEQSLLKRRGK